MKRDVHPIGVFDSGFGGIAILRDNIRQLTEQAAAFSGAADEDLNADRLNEQQAELEKLVRQRDAMKP